MTGEPWPQAQVLAVLEQTAAGVGEEGLLIREERW